MPSANSVLLNRLFVKFTAVATVLFVPLYSIHIIVSLINDHGDGFTGLRG